MNLDRTHSSARPKRTPGDGETPCPGVTSHGPWPQVPGLLAAAVAFLMDPQPANFPGHVIRTSPERVIARFAAQESDYFFKRYHPRGLSHCLKACLRPPAARRARQRLEQLQNRKLPAVDPVGTLTARCSRLAPKLLRVSLLVTRAWEGIPLDQYLGLRPARAQRRIVWQNFAALYGRLLSQGFYHGDPLLDNFLVNRAGELVLVDVDSIKKWPFLSRRMMVSNLIRLYRSLVIQGRRYSDLRLSPAACRNLIRLIVSTPVLATARLAEELDTLFQAAENP